MFTFPYHLTEEEYIRFNQHHFSHSREGKKTQLLCQLLVPFFFLLILLFESIAEFQWESLLFQVAVYTLVTVLYALYVPRILLRSVKRGVQKRKQDGKLPYHESGTLRFEEEQFWDVTPQSETKTFYIAIQKVEVAPTAIYLHIDSVQAFLVPNTVFSSEEEKQRFLQFLQAKTPTAVHLF